MLGLPHSVKYINMKNQKSVRIWATRISDKQLIEIFPVLGSEECNIKEENGSSSAESNRSKGYPAGISMKRILVDFGDLDKGWRIQGTSQGVEGKIFPAVGERIMLFDKKGNECEGNITAKTEIYHIEVDGDTWSRS